MNERKTTCDTRPTIASSLQPLFYTLNSRHSVPDRKGYIYLSAIDWRSAVPDCGQWMVLCEAVQVGYCTAEVKGCVLLCTGGSV
jgi:hypothetical protein